MSRSLLIRVDASREIGAGHAMRMLALAQAWQQRGGRVRMLATAMPEALRSRFEAEQVEFKHVVSQHGGDLSPGSEQDALHTVSEAKLFGALWVVADGYQFDAAYQSKLRQAELRCAVVTDYDFCGEWDCDLILNQNPHATQECYACAVESCQRLLGTHYALLRHEFLSVSINAPARPPQGPKRLLITLGGSDLPNATGRILELLESSDHPRLDVRTLIGVANPHRSTVSATARNSRHNIELLTNVQNMPQQYLWADRIVSAGGGTCWEWLYFGLRGAILVIADNQEPIYRELTTTGTALGMGTVDTLLRDPSVAETALGQLIQEEGPTESQRTRYRHLVDGYGAHRVAARLDAGIWLREATDNDRQLYFQWANDPEVRDKSLCSDPIKWPQHCRWYGEQLASPETHLLVGMRDETAVGQIRLTWTGDEFSDVGVWNVAFSVARESRGTGVGKELIRLGAAWMAYRGLLPLQATVKQENRASVRCFLRLGWEEVTSENADLLQFQFNECFDNS